MGKRRGTSRREFLREAAAVGASLAAAPLLLGGAANLRVASIGARQFLCRPPLPARLSVVLAACALIALVGCRRAAGPPSPSVRAARASFTSTNVSTLQSDAAYRAAEACFARRDYAGALAHIEQLRASSIGRTQAARDFLAHQQEICESALHGARSASNERPPTTGTPRARTPDQADCGPRALALVCERLGVRTSVASLRKLAGTTGRGTTLAGLEKAAKAVGLKAEGVQMDRAALSQLGSPAIAWVDGDHFVAVLSVAGDEATAHDPNHTGEEVMKTDELLRRSGGILLTLSR